ncbi:MAG: DUF6273 domain-containing protein [Eubacterium sp.]|nr:DUF6273 domain-containing protein [Eubacterium sp.]
MAEVNQAELQNRYDKAKALMNSIDCLAKNSDKATALKRAAKRFEALGDYADSAAMAAKCLSEADNYSKKEDNLPPAPKNPLEAKEPSRVAKWVIRIVALLVIVGIIGFFYTNMTDNGAYLKSAFYENIGKHEEAYKMFHNLKDYKDSEQRYLENRYKHGCEALKGKHYWKARDAFRDIRDYKDAGDKLAQAEIATIKKTKKNGDVLFGEAHWLVVEKKKDKVFMIKTKPTNGIAYNTSDENVTWKTSSIREYLNGPFMENIFTPAMQKKIIKTKVVVKDNKEFGTKGCTTTDQVFMLNGDQSYKYGKTINIFLRDYWLIGPGETQREAQFVSSGEVKTAGYRVDDRYINTRPCMWVSIK